MDHVSGKKYIGRYAPSPSGRLHLGNVLTSLLVWLDARAAGGELIFRLEDLDPERSWNDCADMMADDLQWLGLEWDRGWRPGQSPEYTQGARTKLYAAAFETLERRGMVYPCYCSRQQRLAASAPHPGDKSESGCRCASLSAAERAAMERAGKRPAWKVKAPDKTIEFVDRHYGRFSENLAETGDFIIRRADGVYAYQLAVSVDDADMGVTDVVRARDLMPSAARQIWLIRELGGTAPAYCHTPLLTAPNGRKLSKREGDLNMDTLRRRYAPNELIGLMARMCGLRDTAAPVSARELVADFNWQKVKKDDIVIDI